MEETSLRLAARIHEAPRGELLRHIAELAEGTWREEGVVQRCYFPDVQGFQKHLEGWESPKLQDYSAL